MPTALREQTMQERIIFFIVKVKFEHGNAPASIHENV
jgi:hypothetical protein